MRGARAPMAGTSGGMAPRGVNMAAMAPVPHSAEPRFDPGAERDAASLGEDDRLDERRVDECRRAGGAEPLDTGEVCLQVARLCSHRTD